MANLGESINVDSIVPERGEYEPLPAGPYMAQVTDSDVVPTKAGTGSILKLTFEVMEGPFANRKFFTNLNFRNPNATAQRIAQEQIKHLCDAVGHTGPLTDSEVLHYRPLRAQLVIKRDPEYGDKNEVKKISPLSGGAPARPSASAAASTATAAPTAAKPAAVGGKSRPWGGNKAA